MNIFAVVVLCFCAQAASSNPWSLSNVLMTGISAGVEFTNSMAVSQRLAHQHCQRQFRWLRWNCPVKFFLDRNHRPGESTREAAVVDAMTAAAVAHSLTRNCSSGQVAGCSCQRRSGRGGSDWRWGGCSDNLEFGERMSQQFLDMVPVDLAPSDALVRLHNNQAGRQLVKKSARRTCRCHGVSGSCTAQTCWTQIGRFSDVASSLRRKYNKANKLRLTESKRNRASTATLLDFSQAATTDLVFLANSGDFCKNDKLSGIQGSEGRECSRNKHTKSRSERKSCRHLCRACGLSVRRHRTVVSSSCRCKFHWCCHVTCDTCQTVVQTHRCVRS